MPTALPVPAELLVVSRDGRGDRNPGSRRGPFKLLVERADVRLRTDGHDAVVYLQRCRAPHAHLPAIRGSPDQEFS